MVSVTTRQTTFSKGIWVYLINRDLILHTMTWFTERFVRTFNPHAISTGAVRCITYTRLQDSRYNMFLILLYCSSSCHYYYHFHPSCCLIVYYVHVYIFTYWWRWYTTFSYTNLHGCLLHVLVYVMIYRNCVWFVEIVHV